VSRRMKITLPDPLMTQLQELAANNGEPVSRTAARMVCDGLADRHAAHGNHDKHIDTDGPRRLGLRPARTVDRTDHGGSSVEGPDVGLDRGPTRALSASAGASQEWLVERCLPR
jgi:hypothetical protein